jgi:hypothetical protein
MVTFTADPAEHTLRCPEWDFMTPADVDVLVGQAVDLERGSGYQPPPPRPPEPDPVWVAYPVVLLPSLDIPEVGCMGKECRGGVVSAGRSCQAASRVAAAGITAGTGTS